MEEFWKYAVGLMVENFGFAPSLLLIVVGFMYRQQIKEWKSSADRYEAEIDRISDGKSQLWDRLFERTGNKRSSSKDQKPKLNNRG